MYHRVAAEAFDPFGLAVSPANFADQLDWIVRHRIVLPLAEFAALHREGRLPRRAIALTFDDGYACNAQVAAPLLEERRAPATIFLSAELTEGGNEFWWDELERIVLTPDITAVRLDDQEIALGNPDSASRRWPAHQPARTARQSAYRKLWSLLHPLPPSPLDEAMAGLREQARLSSAPRPSHRPLSVQEVREVHSPLIAFGAHALTHPSLPALESVTKRREIGESRSRVAALSGAVPNSFAYPFGDLDAETERLVEEAGFTCACTTQWGFAKRSSRTFALPRLAVGNWPARRLAQVLGASWSAG